MAYTNPIGFRDRFDPLLNYKKLLFIEGNGLQASELNELQDSIRNDLRLVASYLVGDGKVLSGGTVETIISTIVNMNTAGVLIYGHVTQVPAASVTITAVGTEILGIAYIENLISSTNDPTIVELDTASPLVGQPTSYREQAGGRWSLSTGLLTGEIFFPIITLYNGQVITISPSTGTYVDDALNQYDREVRGSAVLRGLNVAYQSLDPTTSSVIMSIGSGKARVRGIPVTVPYQQYALLSAINDTRPLLSDFYVYVVPPSAFTVTPSTSGGSLSAATYYYQVTSVTSGSESFASTTQIVTTTGTTGSVALSWTAVPGAISYSIYGRTSSTVFSYITNVTSTSWTDTGTIAINSAVTAPTSFTAVAHYYPVKDVTQIVGNKTATVTLTKGVSNGVDVIPAPSNYNGALSIVSITSVVQGGTTYSSTNDYSLSGVYSIDWSKTGSEPSAGSTYTITYIYNAVIVTSGTTYVASGNNSFSIAPADTFVNNSTISIAYDFYLKRIDRLSINQFGSYIVTKGTPGYDINNIYPVPSSTDTLSLALITLVYGKTPVVSTDTITNLLVSDWNTLQTQVRTLQTQVSSLALFNQTAAIAPTQIKRGTFVDSLIDTTKMDAGLANTAIQFPDTSSIVGTYSLGIPSSMNLLGKTNNWLTLPFTETVYLNQPLRTKGRRINPYGTPTGPTLNPSVRCNPPVKYANELRWWWHGSFMPDATIISVVCDGFQPGEIVNISLGPTGAITDANQVGGLQVVILPPVIYVNGTTDFTTGSVTIPMTIAAGRPVGIYLVTATGATSGVSATTTMTFATNPSDLHGDFTLKDYLTWNGPFPVPFGVDPIAETYQFSDAVDFTSLGLYVVEKPLADMQVRIVDVAYGIPDTTNIKGQGLVKQASIALGTNKVIFSSPISNVPNKQYAITVLTATSAGALGVAKIGENDFNTGKLVSNQPFAGVLQYSANYSTWTPVQDEDLTFTLYRANYAVNSSITTALITTNSVTNFTDWMISGLVKIPSGTSCRFYLQDSNGTQYDMTPNNTIYTLPISGVVTLYCTMNSVSSNVSPLIPTGFELVGGTAAQPATYTSLAVAVPNGTVTPGTVSLVMTTYNPLNNGIQPQVQLSDNSFSNMTFVSSTPVGNGWNEVTYTYNVLSTNQTRLRLLFSTSNTSIRPKVTNIRFIVV